MPYQWNEDHTELTLKPHRSMTRRGFVVFMSVTMVLWTLPLLSVLGTAALWWMLPFVLLTIAMLWLLIQRNYRDGELCEHLHIDADACHLHRDNPRGPAQDWHCKTYWVHVHMRETNRYIPHYVTLSGNGREVEIGAFLSEDERVSLFDDLERWIGAAKAPTV